MIEFKLTKLHGFVFGINWGDTVIQLFPFTFMKQHWNVYPKINLCSSISFGFECRDVFGKKEMYIPMFHFGPIVIHGDTRWLK